VPAFALAILAKEHALVFLAAAVLHDMFLSRTPPRRILWAAYGAIAAAWAVAVSLLFRGRELSVVADLYLDASAGERLLTVLTVIPHYARLLVSPWSLSSDYGPQVIQLAQSLTAQGIVGLGLLAASVGAVAVLRKRAAAPAFALGWIVISVAPVANVLVVTGVTLAERTLYLAHDRLAGGRRTPHRAQPAYLDKDSGVAQRSCASARSARIASGIVSRPLDRRPCACGCG
jgi:hypothetical protein